MAMPSSPSMSHSRLEDGSRPGGLLADERVSAFMVCMNVISTVTHLLLGAVVFFAFFIINAVSGYHYLYEIVSAHVYLTVIGYMILMSQAIFSLNPQTGWANNFKYPRKTLLFWLLQVLGSFLAIIGPFIAIMANVAVKGWYPDSNHIPGGSHLQSTHQVVGLVAMILTAVSFVGALYHLFKKNTENKKTLRTLQSCSITLALVIAFIAIAYAFNEEWGAGNIKSTRMAISLVFLTLIGMFMMMLCKAIEKSRFKFRN